MACFVSYGVILNGLLL